MLLAFLQLQLSSLEQRGLAFRQVFTLWLLRGLSITLTFLLLFLRDFLVLVCLFSELIFLLQKSHLFIVALGCVVLLLGKEVLQLDCSIEFVLVFLFLWNSPLSLHYLFNLPEKRVVVYAFRSVILQRLALISLGIFGELFMRQGLHWNVDESILIEALLSDSSRLFPSFALFLLILARLQVALFDDLSHEFLVIFF